MAAEHEWLRASLCVHGLGLSAEVDSVWHHGLSAPQSLQGSRNNDAFAHSRGPREQHSLLHFQASLQHTDVLSIAQKTLQAQLQIWSSVTVGP